MKLYSALYPLTEVIVNFFLFLYTKCGLILFAFTAFSGIFSMVQVFPLKNFYNKSLLIHKHPPSPLKQKERKYLVPPGHLA